MITVKYTDLLSHLALKGQFTYNFTKPISPSGLRLRHAAAGGGDGGLHGGEQYAGE